MTIRYARAARRELVTLVEHIAKEDPRAASRLGDRILDVVDKLCDGAFDGFEQVLTDGRRVRS